MAHLRLRVPYGDIRWRRDATVDVKVGQRNHEYQGSFERGDLQMQLFYVCLLWRGVELPRQHSALYAESTESTDLIRILSR